MCILWTFCPALSLFLLGGSRGAPQSFLSVSPQTMLGSLSALVLQCMLRFSSCLSNCLKGNMWVWKFCAGNILGWILGSELWILG